MESNASLSSVPTRGTNKLTATKEGEDVDSDQFIAINEILDDIPGKLAMFKTDTDGCDIGIVEQFLNHDASIDCPVFMEFDTSFKLSPQKQVAQLLKTFADREYSCAVFTNRGLPLLFQNHLQQEIMLDLSNYCILQKNFRLKMDYLDLFLFPKSKDFLWKKIADGYRLRKFI